MSTRTEGAGGTPRISPTLQRGEVSDTDEPFQKNTPGFRDCELTAITGWSLSPSLNVTPHSRLAEGPSFQITEGSG